MPKPYLVQLEIEEIALGAVMRRLHSMPGVAAVHLNLDETAARRPYNGGKPHAATGKPKPGSTIRSAMLKGMRDGKDYDNAAIAAIFAKAKLKVAPQHVRQHADNAMRGGLLTRVAPGTYKLTAKGRDYLKQIEA